MTTDRPDTLRDLVMSTARGLRRRWVDALEPWQLSPHEYRALHVIGHGDGDGPRLGDVAKALRIAPRSATEVVDRLQDRGLDHSGASRSGSAKMWACNATTPHEESGLDLMRNPHN